MQQTDTASENKRRWKFWALFNFLTNLDCLVFTKLLQMLFLFFCNLCLAFCKRVRKRVTQTVEQEEDEFGISSFLLLKAKRSANQIETRTHPNLFPDTPDSVQASPETPHSEHRHPCYEHQAKPKYRRELTCNRTETPLTTART